MRPGIWFVLAITVAISFTNLGAARLWDRDEPRNAQCAKEMLEAGQWVVPTFDGELRTHKPILIYWCQITAYKIFGVNEFAARLPSALASILTVLCVYWIGRRLASEQVAVWSAVALSTMILFVMAGRAATPDSLLIATSTLAIALFTQFAFTAKENSPQLSQPRSNVVPDLNFFAEESAGQSFLHPIQFCWPTFGQWTLVYAACGLAVLAKGPVGLVLPVAVMGLTILLVGSTKSLEKSGGGGGWLSTALTPVVVGWKMRPFLAIACVLLIAGPWYAAVGLATDGVWLKEFFLTHNVSRAVQPMEGHTGPPILFYVGALLVGTFPWSCFAIPIGLSVWSRWKQCRHDRQSFDPMMALGLSWVGIYVTCFSIASTKLPSYVTPCHPGIALIVGWYVARAVAGQVDHPRWMKAGLAVAFMIGIGIFVAIGGPLSEQVPTVRPLAFAGVVFAVSGMLGVALAARRKTGLAMRAFVIGAVSVVWLLHGFGPSQVDRGRRDLDSLQAAFEAAPERVWWISGSPEPSWVFYSNRRVRMGEPTVEDILSIDAGRIEMLTEAKPGSVPVFLEEQFLQISALPAPRVAER